jgi:acetyl esterase/lipase
MKTMLNPSKSEPLLTVTEGITYAQRMEMGNGSIRSLKISLIRPRQFFTYDQRITQPVIVFICGGAFTEMDRNYWIAELAWFAKRGYNVASIDYSRAARTRFPQQIIDVKEAIRYLRANADFWGLDAEHFAVMGESAGGYLAALAGATCNTKEYDKGTNLEYSSAVQASIPWYPLIQPSTFPICDFLADFLPPDLKDYADITELVKHKTPPYMILHGTADTQVPVNQSEKLYDALISAGNEADLIILEGAEHAESQFIQPEIKELILNFLNRLFK